MPERGDLDTFIGLDVGTTNCKAVIIDEEGRPLAQASQEYCISHPKARWAEQDALEVWQTVKNVIKNVVFSSGVTEITAVSLSVQGDAVVAVDRCLNPLRPVILGMDYRSKPQSDRCAQVFGGENLFRITGMPPHPLNSLTKILWIKEEEPEIYEAAWKFMTYADYILAKLGADPVIDYTMASRTMAFDLASRSWSDQILSKLGISKDLLSSAVPSGQVVGRLLDSLRHEFRITSEVALVTGGHDQTCAALGAGVTGERIGVDSTGTAEVLSTAFAQPRLGEEMYRWFYPCYIYVDSNLYFTFALNHTGGIVLQWFRDEFYEMEKKKAIELNTNAYDLIVSQMPKDPTKLFFFPHLNGTGTPTCDLDAKGSVLGLSLETTKGELAKAILEGLTFELRLNLDYLSQTKVEIDEIVAVGGGSRSEEWLKLKANITGRPIKTLKNIEAACFGAAILAAVGFGHYGGLREAVSEWVQYERTHEPTQRLLEMYNEKYSVYRKLYDESRAITAQV